MKRMKKAIFATLSLVSFSMCAFAQTSSKGTSSAYGVIRRFCGDSGINLKLKRTSAPGSATDRFTYSVDAKGQLTVQGNSPVALCRGFYDYIRTNGYGICSWSGNRLDLPVRLDPQEPKTVTSPFRHHYCYNVVTYGYTTPYWDWNRWEREIDWMALHGMDMPLALVANEAISARVWKKLGLTDDEIQRYFVGPAHLPWMRMGNISGVDSPMPASWHKDQIALQHRILSRMRSLGMKPICPGFAGFLPPEIKRIFPEANVVQSEWAGFHNWMLMADDPLFVRIGKMFIEEWENEFGKCDYYIADSFNEMSVPFPPKGSSQRYDKLAQYGRAVYEGIRSANPDATWVMQGWMLGFTRSIWDYESYSALMRNVPDNRVLILDMAEDYNYHLWKNTANWEYFKGFDNKQWVYSTIPNMGGDTGMTGILEFYANGGRLDALKSPFRGNLVGYGTAPEGTENNEAVYELICDAGWTADSISLRQWLQNYTECRYGKADPDIAAYWDEITQSVYGNFADHPRFVWQLRPGRSSKGTYPVDSLFFTAIEKFAKAAPRMKDSPRYVDDLVELSAQYAGGKMEVLVQNVLQAALWCGGVEKIDSIQALFDKIALAADRVLAAHPVHNLQRWIDFARSHATSPEEAAYYEKNAKRIVTVWGPPVNDYSARIWSGLVRDFYKPRYDAYFNSLKSGQPFDYAAWERDWVENSKGLSPVTPPDDIVRACLDLIGLARPVFHKSTALADERELGVWVPSMVSTQWKEVEWNVPVSELKGLLGVSFRWVRGGQKLEINKVSLEVDGQIVAVNEHFGETGLNNRNNDYRLDLPAQLGGNNGVILRAVVRSTNNCESFGKVVMIHK